MGTYLRRCIASPTTTQDSYIVLYSIVVLLAGTTASLGTGNIVHVYSVIHVACIVYAMVVVVCVTFCTGAGHVRANTMFAVILLILGLIILTDQTYSAAFDFESILGRLNVFLSTIPAIIVFLGSASLEGNLSARWEVQTSTILMRNIPTFVVCVVWATFAVYVHHLWRTNGLDVHTLVASIYLVFMPVVLRISSTFIRDMLRTIKILSSTIQRARTNGTQQ